MKTNLVNGCRGVCSVFFVLIVVTLLVGNFDESTQGKVDELLDEGIDLLGSLLLLKLSLVLLLPVHVAVV